MQSEHEEKANSKISDNFDVFDRAIEHGAPTQTLTVILSVYFSRKKIKTFFQIIKI